MNRRTLFKSGGAALLGLGLGVANAVAHHNRRHVCEKCGMIAVVIGILVALLAAIGLVSPPLMFLGAALIAAGLPLLLWGGGVRGALDIMGTMGNIMSYARLMAIGGCDRTRKSALREVIVGLAELREVMQDQFEDWLREHHGEQEGSMSMEGCILTDETGNRFVGREIADLFS